MCFLFMFPVDVLNKIIHLLRGQSGGPYDGLVGIITVPVVREYFQIVVF